MKKNWISFLNQIQTEMENIKSEGCDTICFRGHADKDWNLYPTLFVLKEKLKLQDSAILNKENNIFSDFITNAGSLINSNLTDWEILFLMRHHGIPTRLLDWTENFGTALFFALNGNGKTPTIWMFNPHKLNEITYSNPGIPNPINDLIFNYSEAYLDKTANPFVNPICIIPARNSDRLFAQKGLFTLHGSNIEPLNKIKGVSNCFKKFEVPIDCIDEAKKFLTLAGINHYSIFPDLDGLSKHLTQEYF